LRCAVERVQGSALPFAAALGTGGFGGDDVPALGGEPFGIAAGAGADIAHEAGLGGEVREGVDVGGAEGVVGLGKFADAVVVGGDGVPAHGVIRVLRGWSVVGWGDRVGRWGCGEEEPPSGSPLLRMGERRKI
jgi:hypothetical protein